MQWMYVEKLDASGHAGMTAGIVACGPDQAIGQIRTFCIVLQQLLSYESGH